MKQIWKWIIVVPIVFGIVVAGWITIKNERSKFSEKKRIENLFSNLSSKPIKITKFYTYGTSFNIEGEIEGVSEDNFEGAKLVLRDGKNFEKTYPLSNSVNDGKIVFYTETINKSVNLDELEARKILCSD